MIRQNEGTSGLKLIVLFYVGSLTHGGFSICTARYRYAEWVNGKHRKNPLNILYSELYDHFIDPGVNGNRAGDEEYEEVTAELSQMLRPGWREALLET